MQRIPKKNYQKEDPTTLRDISLSSVIYKIFLRCLIQRILPFVEIQIDFWQRAFLKGRNRQELIFTLKTALDDLRHVSSKLHILFIDLLMLKEVSSMKRCLIAGYSLKLKSYFTRGPKIGDSLSVFVILASCESSIKTCV